MLRSPPKDPFSVRELETSQWSWSFTWENISDRSLRHFCSKASQPLTSLYPADSEVTAAQFPRRSPTSKSTA
ncbi:hypothetical protein TNCV_5064551 [Trichonephila clavipes]|nr:hypothetical protein TNCV_5064551 [Trichonephila clavipes]